MKQLLLLGLLLVCGVSLYAMERGDGVFRETVKNALLEFKSEIEGFQEEALSHLLSKQMRQKMGESDVKGFKDKYKAPLYADALACYNAISKSDLSTSHKNADLMQQIDIFRSRMQCVVQFAELQNLVKKFSCYSVSPEDRDKSSEEYKERHLIWKAASEFSLKENDVTQNDNNTISRYHAEIQKHINAFDQELIKQAKKNLKTLGAQFYRLIESCNDNKEYSEEECDRYGTLNNNALKCLKDDQASIEEINFYITCLNKRTEEIKQKPTLNKNENLKLPNLFSLKKRMLIVSGIAGAFMGVIGGSAQYRRYAERAHKNGKQTVLDRLFAKGKSVLKRNAHTG